MKVATGVGISGNTAVGAYAIEDVVQQLAIENFTDVGGNSTCVGNGILDSLLIG